MKKIIGFSSFPDFSGNSKALFEDLNKLKSEYELIWFCKEEKVAEKLNNKGIKAIWDKASNFESEFKKVQIMINTHDDYLSLKQDGQIFIDLWHGLGLKKGGFLLENELDWNYKFSTKNDYLIAPSELGRFIFSSIFNKSLYSVKQFPQARYKWLFESDGKSNLEKVLKKDLKKFSKIIMYAPTFKQGLGRQETHVNKNNLLNLDDYDEDVLIQFLQKNNYLLVLKPHPSEENNLKQLNTDNVIILKDKDMLEEFITINEILNGIDLLISDYSSIYIDFINLERPVLFLDTDKEEYLKNRGVLFDSIDFWWSCGPRLHNVNTLIEQINKLFNNASYYKKERQQFNELINGSEEKTNEKLIEFISKLDSVGFKMEISEKYKILNKELNIENKILMENMQNKMNKTNEEMSKLKHENLVLKDENEFLKKEYEKLRIDMDKIIYSRSYKILNKLKGIIKRG